MSATRVAETKEQQLPNLLLMPIQTCNDLAKKCKTKEFTARDADKKQFKFLLGQLNSYIQTQKSTRPKIEIGICYHILAILHTQCALILRAVDPQKTETSRILTALTYYMNAVTYVDKGKDSKTRDKVLAVIAPELQVIATQPDTLSALNTLEAGTKAKYILFLEPYTKIAAEAELKAGVAAGTNLSPEAMLKAAHALVAEPEALAVLKNAAIVMQEGMRPGNSTPSLEAMLKATKLLEAHPRVLAAIHAAMQASASVAPRPAAAAKATAPAAAKPAAAAATASSTRPAVRPAPASAIPAAPSATQPQSKLAQIKIDPMPAGTVAPSASQPGKQPSPVSAEPMASAAVPAAPTPAAPHSTAPVSAASAPTPAALAPQPTAPAPATLQAPTNATPTIAAVIKKRPGLEIAAAAAAAAAVPHQPVATVLVQPAPPARLIPQDNGVTLFSVSPISTVCSLVAALYTGEFAPTVLAYLWGKVADLAVEKCCTGPRPKI